MSSENPSLKFNQTSIRYNNRWNLPPDRKVPFAEKLGFAIGDCGYNLMYYWVSTMLMIFYTDVFKIDPAQVAILMLVVRVFDAVNDPIIGSMADRTKQKTGTYKRWVQWGSFGLGVTCVFLFWAHPEWPMAAKIVYMYITYMLVVCFSTATNMPYGVLNGTMTTDGLERTKISTLRMFCITLGNMGVTALAVPVLNAFGQSSGKPVQAYILTLIVFSAVAVPMLWTTAFKTKEVVAIPKEQKLPMSERIKMLNCKPVICIIVGMIAYGFVYYGRAAVYPYYFTYYCNLPELLTFFAVLIGIGGIIGSLLSTKLHQLCKSKSKAALINMVLCGIFIALMFFVDPVNAPIPFYILTLLNGITQGIHLCLQYAMIPDAIDVAYYKHGKSAPGFLYTLTSLGFKIGNAVATALVAAVFSMVGYVANVAQNATVLSTINLMFSIIAAVFCIITGILFFGAGLTDEKFEKVSAEIKKRELEEAQRAADAE